MLLLLGSGSDLCDILQIIVNQVFLGFQGNLHCLQARIGPEEKQKIGLFQTNGGKPYLDVRNLGDCEHPTNEEPREYIVVIHIFSQPHFDLQSNISSTTSQLQCAPHASR